ncbi:MAG: hypothetical protein ACHREM_16475 [Polyangiales bacterium]
MNKSTRSRLRNVLLTSLDGHSSHDSLRPQLARVMTATFWKPSNDSIAVRPMVGTGRLARVVPITRP